VGSINISCATSDSGLSHIILHSADAESHCFHASLIVFMDEFMQTHKAIGSPHIGKPHAQITVIGPSGQKLHRPARACCVATLLK